MGVEVVKRWTAAATASWFGAIDTTPRQRRGDVGLNWAWVSWVGESARALEGSLFRPARPFAKPAGQCCVDSPNQRWVRSNTRAAIRLRGCTR